MIEWKETKDGAWEGYLGNTLWCEWIPPYDEEDMRQGGYVFGIAIDGHIIDAETIEYAKLRASLWTLSWLKKANLISLSDIYFCDKCGDSGEFRENVNGVSVWAASKEQCPCTTNPMSIWSIREAASTPK